MRERLDLSVFKLLIAKKRRGDICAVIGAGRFIWIRKALPK
jgi:hypothetical protein